MLTRNIRTNLKTVIPASHVTVSMRDPLVLNVMDGPVSANVRGVSSEGPVIPA